MKSITIQMHGSLEIVKQTLTMQLLTGKLTGNKFFWCKEWWINIQIHGNSIKNQVFLRNELLKCIPIHLIFQVISSLTHFTYFIQKHTLKKCGTMVFLCIKRTPHFWSNFGWIKASTIHHISSLYAVFLFQFLLLQHPKSSSFDMWLAYVCYFDIKCIHVQNIACDSLKCLKCYMI